MRFQIHSRVLLLCIVFVAAFSALSVRLVYLQVVLHEENAEAALRKQVQKVKLPAKRGAIYDRSNELLACTQRVYTVVADRKHLGNYDIARRGLAKAEGLTVHQVARKYRYDEKEVESRYLTRLVRVLAHPLGYHGWELRQRLDSKNRGEIFLRKNVEEDAYRELKELVRQERLGGIYFRSGFRRYYPSPRTLTHVIGYVNHEGVAQEGLERKMDQVMRGSDGSRIVTNDPRGREIAAYRGETIEPVHGHDVRLTIDMGLQNIVEAALDEAWYECRPEKICAVFMRPKTGEILAMASRPHFDLETREGDLHNHAISDFYEPGSTFKIVAMSMAFDKRLVNRNTTIFCHYGRLEEGALTVLDHSSFGDLTVEQIIARSSNIGTYKVAAQVGRETFYEYMRRFGFGDATGIELTGETSGRVYPVEGWSLPSFSSMARGYEVGVTPLQMANALAVIANGGTLMRPYLVDAVLDSKGRVIEQTKPEVVRRVIHERAAREVGKMLVAVVGDEHGTGKAAAIEGFTVAGKTGTARKYCNKKGDYLPGRYVASFMGFLPADDPELVGIVVVDDPQTMRTSRGGGSVAAPIFSAIGTEAVALLDIEPDQDSRLAARTAQ